MLISRAFAPPVAAALQVADFALRQLDQSAMYVAAA